MKAHDSFEVMAINLVHSASPHPPAQNTTALREVFETIQADSCPTSYNFHMHTICSDGRLKPEELIEQAVVLDLKGLAITDHHSVRGYKAAQCWLDKVFDHSKVDAPHLWTGAEITSKLLEIEVHILCYAFDPEHPAMQLYLQGKAPRGSDAEAANVITAVHQAGGLAVLAHPSRYRLRATELVRAAAEIGIDGMETYYAYNNPSPWKPSPKETTEAIQLATTYRLLNTCGTDTHGLSLLQRL
jgi:hypothetical protein